MLSGGGGLRRHWFVASGGNVGFSSKWGSSPTSTAAHASRTIAIAAIKRRNNICIVGSGSCGRAPISHGKHSCSTRSRGALQFSAPRAGAGMAGRRKREPPMHRSGALRERLPGWGLVGRISSQGCAALRYARFGNTGPKQERSASANRNLFELIRACVQLSSIVMAASCTPARKFLASLS